MIASGRCSHAQWMNFERNLCCPLKLFHIARFMNLHLRGLSSGKTARSSNQLRLNIYRAFPTMIQTPLLKFSRGANSDFPFSLTFAAGAGILDYGFQSFSGLDFLDCNAHLVFEKTGELRYITGDFYALRHNTGEKISVSDEYVRTYLHAKCDYLSNSS